MGQESLKPGYLQAYPWQWLCFGLGIVPAGLLGAIGSQSIHDAVFVDASRFIFFAFSAGLVSVFIGFYLYLALEGMKIPKKWQAFWLALLIPPITFFGLGLCCAFIVN
jgi:hypothetical protein